VCFACGYRWAISGVDPRREIGHLAQMQGIYIVRGTVAWLVAAVPFVLIVLQNPIAALTTGTTAMTILLAMVLTGAILGCALQLSIQVSGWLFPRIAAIHLALPLIVAAVIGASSHQWLFAVANLVHGTAIPLRSEGVAVVTGIILALIVTPAIIIRSSKAIARAGLTPPPPSAHDGDVRWRS
jgi:hypothetical protein